MRRLQLLCFALLLAAVGCGGPSFQVAPVSGKVTWKGKPLANANVNFGPTGSKEPGPGSRGKTDAEGRYQLRLETTDADGAVVGPHVVRISVMVGAKGADPGADAGPGTLKETLPLKYNSETTLKFTVPPAGTDKADFDLTP